MVVLSPRCWSTSYLIFLFGRKKAVEISPLEVTVSSRLQEFCGGDTELYNALSRLMFLDPKKITLPLESVLSEARDYELQGNSIRTEVGYRVAGGISLYKGEVEGVRTYFSKAASYAGDSHPEYKTIIKRADEAVTVARKFYENSDSIRL